MKKIQPDTREHRCDLITNYFIAQSILFSGREGKSEAAKNVKLLVNVSNVFDAKDRDID